MPDCMRAEQDVASLYIELARTFRRQSIAIFLVLLFRCLVSFTAINDLTHPTNDAWATIVLFYVIQLLFEYAICWNHASTDYRTVVDAGLWGDGPRRRRENGKRAKKGSISPLKGTILSRLVARKRFKGQPRPPFSDSTSDIVPLMRPEISTLSQTSTLVSTYADDMEKQRVLSFPSTSSQPNPLASTSIDVHSTYLIEEKDQERRLSVPFPPLVKDVRAWTLRRPIWDW